MPPMTVVSPSFTSTWVLASFRWMAGWPLAPVLEGSGWLFSALIAMRMLPSWVMCGVTSSDRRASTKVVFTPAADTWLKGRDTPWLIFAVLLSRVVTLGAEMVFTVPWFSRAERRRLSATAPPAEPKTKPSAPPEPVPTAAGRLTANSGADAVPALPSDVEPPDIAAVYGNTKPVGLPVAGANWAWPP